MLHVATHAFSKITLFFCAGAIYVASRRKNISELGGLGRAMPVTFGAFGIASLSMIGVPPVGGFLSKWYVLNGAWDAGAAGIVVVLLASTLLNAAYFAPVVYAGFFGRPENEESGPPASEAPWAMVLPLSVTALLSFVLGICPEALVGLVKRVFA
jgi:multicomponent Na+:H+ antiporter subunit D